MGNSYAHFTKKKEKNEVRSINNIPRVSLLSMVRPGTSLPHPASWIPKPVVKKLLRLILGSPHVGAFLGLKLKHLFWKVGESLLYHSIVQEEHRVNEENDPQLRVTCEHTCSISAPLDQLLSPMWLFPKARKTPAHTNTHPETKACVITGCQSQNPPWQAA